MSNNLQSRIYLAAPFFSDEQNERLKLVKEHLEANKTVGYIYEPADHQQTTIVNKYGSLDIAMTTREWQDATFRSDTQAIRQADAIVAILDYDYEHHNLVPDPGTIYEIGYAQALGKPIILIQATDVGNDPLNLMLTQYTAYFDHKDLNGYTTNDLVTYDFINFPQVNNDERLVF